MYYRLPGHYTTQAQFILDLQQIPAGTETLDLSAYGLNLGGIHPKQGWEWDTFIDLIRDPATGFKIVLPPSLHTINLSDNGLETKSKKTLLWFFTSGVSSVYLGPPNVRFIFGKTNLSFWEKTSIWFTLRKYCSIQWNKISREDALVSALPLPIELCNLIRECEDYNFNKIKNDCNDSYSKIGAAITGKYGLPSGGCALLRLDYVPSYNLYQNGEFKDLDCEQLGFRDGFIRVHNALYYADRTNRTVTEIRSPIGKEALFHDLKRMCSTPQWKLADAEALAKIHEITGISFPVNTNHKKAALYHLSDIMSSASRANQEKEQIRDRLLRWKKSYQPCIETHQNPVLKYMSSYRIFKCFIPETKTASLVNGIMRKFDV